MRKQDLQNFFSSFFWQITYFGHTRPVILLKICGAVDTILKTSFGVIDTNWKTSSGTIDTKWKASSGAIDANWKTNSAAIDAILVTLVTRFWAIFGHL